MSQPGDSLRVTRGPLAPEGAGVAYTVPNPVPAGPVTVTLQALAEHGRARHRLAPRPGSCEQVNAERASPRPRAAHAVEHADPRGRRLRPLPRVHTGSSATSRWPTPACAPWTRAGPCPAARPSARRSRWPRRRSSRSTGWKNSAPHWTLLMMDGLDSVGVARAGSRWIMMAADCGAAASPARCGLNGDPAARPPGSGSPAPPTDEAGHRSGRRARSRASRCSVRRHGRRLVVGVRVTRGEGHVTGGRAEGRAASATAPPPPQGRPAPLRGAAAEARPLEGRDALRRLSRLGRPPPGRADRALALTGRTVVAIAHVAPARASENRRQIAPVHAARL